MLPYPMMRETPELQSNGPPAIAILPFRIAGADRVLDAFARRMRQGLVEALKAMPDVEAVLANTPFDSNQPASYTILTTLRPASVGVRCFLELADAHSGILIWTHSCVSETPEPARIRELLTPWLHDAELSRMRGKHPLHMTAYDLVLQARELMFRFKRASFEEAGSLLWQAMALEPNHPTAQKLFTDWAKLWEGGAWADEPAVSTTPATVD